MHEKTWPAIGLFDERSWFDLEGDRPEWDERRPTGELIRELFGLRHASKQTLPEPTDEVLAYLIGSVKDAGSVLHQLQEEARARATLHDQAMHELDYQISRAAIGLTHFKDFGVGYNTGVDMRRTHLERELSQLRRERRTTLQRTWQDVASLREEFRDALAEYKSRLSRLKVL